MAQSVYVVPKVRLETYSDISLMFGYRSFNTNIRMGGSM